MKSLTRLISLLICFAMLFSCVLVHADEAAEEVIVYGVEENGLITALGIAEYEEADLTGEITRGEFYALLCKANAYPETKSAEKFFSDLEVGADYEGWTKTLYKVGIITTTRDGKVNVADSITGAEATSLVMRTLGYGPRAEALGGYPTGYLAVANQADVTDGIEEVLSKNLTKGMAVELIYNALHADMMVQSFGSGDAEYKVIKDTNLLNTAFGIEIAEGCVDGVDISRVIGLNDVNPFHIEVGGVSLESRAIANPYSYLGYHVEAYYTNKRFDEPKVIYLHKTDLNEEHVFDLEDISEVSGNKVKAYTENGKSKNYSFEKGVAVIFNGVATKQAFSEKLWEGLSGTLRLLDNTGDGTADIVFVDAYENFVVSHYDAADKVVYYKGDNTRKLTLDNTTNDPYVILYDKFGEEIQPNKLGRDVVVSLYHSAPDAYQQYVRAYLSSDTVVGEIEEVLDGGEEIVVDGKTYEVNKNAISKISGLLKPGTAVVLYTDYLGKVADASIDTGLSFEYGFVVAAGTEGNLDSVVKFVFFRQDGTTVETYASNAIRVDGVRYAKHDVSMLYNLYQASVAMFGHSLKLPEGETFDTVSKKVNYYLSQKYPVGSVVRFALNANGEVNAIDTLMYDSETVADRNSDHSNKNSFFGSKQSSVYYRAYGSHRTIGPKVVVNADTMMMYYPVVTPSNPDIAFDEDQYLSVKFASSVGHNKLFSTDVWAFYTSDKQIVCNLIGSAMSTGAGGNIMENTKLAVVDYMSKGLDPVDGEAEVDYVVFLSDSGKVKVPVKPGNTNIDLTTLSKGDVVRFARDYQGYLSKVEVYYKPSTGKGIVTSYENAAYSSTTAIRKGYVYQAFKEGAYVYFNNELTGDLKRDKEKLGAISIEDCEFVYYSVTTPAVYKYEKDELDKFQVSGGSAAGLKSYLETGDDCSFVIVHTYNGQPWGIVEYVGLDIPEPEPGNNN